MKNSRTKSDWKVYVLPCFFLITVLGYFYYIGNYILFFQETQSLFIFSGDYFGDFLLRPGGLLVYSARFLSQFYAGRFEGSLILSLILTLPGVVLYFINERLIPGTLFSQLFLLIPSCLLLIMQVYYYHLMEYNLGFLLILIYYLLVVNSKNKYQKAFLLLFFPLFYYIVGGYALIFVLIYFVHSLFFETGKQKFIYGSSILIIAAITFLIFWKIIFLLPVEQILVFPVKVLESPVYRVTFILLSCYIILYPLICGVVIKLNLSRFNKGVYSFFSIIIVSAVTIFALIRVYNPQTARVLELQRLIFGEKWTEAIRFQEKKPSRNLIGQYFYNIALSETDQLCNRLFYGSQDFKTGTLVLPWGEEHLNRGAYFYYCIGLINEAHRWAYEEMVVYGFRPQNLKMLAKTSLIKGDYRMARKYLNILKMTIYYRAWALKYEKMADNPDLITSDQELGAKIKILPKSDFFIRFNDPMNNLPIILNAQPDNRKAFEYYIAGLLLSKNAEAVVNNVRKMKGMGYTSIPRHIEEAVLMYYNSTKMLPDLGGLTISAGTQTRFADYVATFKILRQTTQLNSQKMEQKFGNTFWFYFQFK